MKKIGKIFLKYYKISLIISMLIIVTTIIYNIFNGTLAEVNFRFILNTILGYIKITLVLIPFTAFLDFMFYQPAKAITKDLMADSTSGKILFLVSFVLVLLRKIYIWTR